MAREREKAEDIAGEKRGDNTYLPYLDPNSSNVRVFYLMELDEVFRDLIAHPVAISMVQSVLGEDFLISNFTANIARPGSESMALHSDQSIVVPDPWIDVTTHGKSVCFPTKVEEIFYGDCTPEQIAEAKKDIRPMATSVMLHPAKYAAWKHIPSTYM